MAQKTDQPEPKPKPGKPGKPRKAGKAASRAETAPALPTITGQRSELGALLAQRLRGAGGGSGAGADAGAARHFNLAGQQANTLLHDGHAWKDFARLARDGARRALRAQAADGGLLVHASFAFVAVLPPKDPLRSLAQQILDIEQTMLASPAPVCVVRLGYLYGPTSRDLLAYRTAFKLGRPYWAGARRAAQYHLHHDDAVSALLAAGRAGNAGQSFDAIAGEPLPFMAFMDHFARRLGKRVVLHAPRLAAPMFKLVVCTEHMQQVELAMPAATGRPALPRWTAQHTDHLAALDAIVTGWQA